MFLGDVFVEWIISSWTAEHRGKVWHFVSFAKGEDFHNQFFVSVFSDLFDLTFFYCPEERFLENKNIYFT